MESMALDKRAVSEANPAMRAGSADQFTTNQAKSRAKVPSKESNKQSPPTHFLALPLVTAASLPQLARSIAHFQFVTTASRAIRPSEAHARELARAQVSPEPDDTGVGALKGAHEEGEVGSDEVEETLKIIPAQAQRPPGTLHLTLGTMILKSKEDMRRALDVLRSVDFKAMLVAAQADAPVISAENNAVSEATATQNDGQTKLDEATDAGEDVTATLKTLRRGISPPPPGSITTNTADSATTSTSLASQEPPPPLILDLKGLNTFPSARRSRVFYANPYDPSGRLQSFAEAVQQRFIEEGIVVKEGRALTLHATVANLKYVKTPKSSSGKKAGGARADTRRGSGSGREGREVDAQGVIDVFNHRGGLLEAEDSDEAENNAAFVWAKEIVVDRIRICKMGAVKSQVHVMGMEYPAIRVSEEDNADDESEIAEVVFA